MEISRSLYKQLVDKLQGAGLKVWKALPLADEICELFEKVEYVAPEIQPSKVLRPPYEITSNTSGNLNREMTDHEIDLAGDIKEETPPLPPEIRKNSIDLEHINLMNKETQKRERMREDEEIWIGDAPPKGFKYNDDKMDLPTDMNGATTVNFKKTK